MGDNLAKPGDNNKRDSSFYKVLGPSISKITTQMKVNCDVHGSQFAILHEGDVYCKKCYDKMMDFRDNKEK